MKAAALEAALLRIQEELALIRAEQVALRGLVQALATPAAALAPSVVSLATAAKALDCSIRTVRRLIGAGDLQVVMISSTPKVPTSELARLATPVRQGLLPRRPLRRGLVARAGAALQRAELAKLEARRPRRRETPAEAVARLQALRKQRRGAVGPPA